MKLKVTIILLAIIAALFLALFASLPSVLPLFLRTTTVQSLAEIGDRADNIAPTRASSPSYRSLLVEDTSAIAIYDAYESLDGRRYAEDENAYVKVDSSVNTDGIMRSCEALIKDEPLLSVAYASPDSGSVTSCVSISGGKLKLSDERAFSYAEQQEKEAEVRKWVEESASEIASKTDSPTAQVRLALHCVVDGNAYGGGNSAWSAAIGKSSYCLGNACALKLLLDELGYENIIVTGEVSDGPHAIVALRCESGVYAIDPSMCTSWRAPVIDSVEESFAILPINDYIQAYKLVADDDSSALLDIL